MTVADAVRREALARRLDEHARQLRAMTAPSVAQLEQLAAEIDRTSAGVDELAEEIDHATCGLGDAAWWQRARERARRGEVAGEPRPGCEHRCPECGAEPDSPCTTREGAPLAGGVTHAARRTGSLFEESA